MHRTQKYTMENNYKKISRTLIFQLAWCSLAFGKSSLYTNEKAIPIDFYTSMNKSGTDVKSTSFIITSRNLEFE